MTRLRVLGAAAGGGLPQWNCGCQNCEGVRRNAIDARPRSQIGAAISADEREWVLLGASPDVRAQIEAFPALWPRAPRHSPIAAVVLTSGDLDGCLGLFALRESQRLRVFATRAVREGLERNAMLRTLARFEGHTRWEPLVIGARTELGAGISAEVIAVPGKVPLHLEGIAEPSPEDAVGLVLHGKDGASLAWLPSVGAPTPELLAVLDRVDAVFFDGTFWSSDELVTLGSHPHAPPARAEAMAHWPVGDASGSLHALARSRARRRVLVHVNNTNPVLRDRSPERAQLEAAGIEVAYDGMEVMLGAPAASTRAGLAERLRAESASRYHDQHPFHVAMHEGRLTREQLRAWVANRFYYQTRIPLKDALILAKSEDPAFRRAWIRRVHDHDDPGGGLELWQRLGEAVGLTRAELASHAGVLPGVRRACDDYVELVRGAPLVVAVAASLTERLAPQLMQARIGAWMRHYPWVAAEGLEYFRRRVSQARADGDDALAFVLERATTAELHDRCVAALVRKTEILWAMLDAIARAYGIGPLAERPRVAGHVRLREDAVRGGAVLLAPDRALRLDPNAERIVRLCDGSRTVGEIVALLAAEHADEERAAIERDVGARRARLVGTRAGDGAPARNAASS